MTSTQFSPTTVPIEFAESAIEAGNKRAAEIGLPFTITVVDAGTDLVAASRMDGDVLGSIEVSATKARHRGAIRTTDQGTQPRGAARHDHVQYRRRDRWACRVCGRGHSAD